MKKLDLSVIIPCYNEEKIIYNTIESIFKFLKNKNYELIIVDDGSDDKTRKIVKQFKNVILNNKRPNKGKGYSVKEGILIAKGNKILISDADLSASIDQFQKLDKFIDKYEIVIGSRGLKESKVENYLYRKFLGFIGRLFVKLIVKEIKDTQCGFKLFNIKIAKKLFSMQTIDGFGFDFEILFLAQKHNYKIKEVPLNWKVAKESKVRPVHYINTLIELISILIKDFKGKYES